MSVLNTQARKARKDHRCYNCHHAIKAGETYTYLSGVFDGEGWSDKTHTDCREAEIALNKHFKTDFSDDDWGNIINHYEGDGKLYHECRDYLELNFPTIAERLATTFGQEVEQPA